MLGGLTNGKEKLGLAIKLGIVFGASFNMNSTHGKKRQSRWAAAKGSMKIGSVFVGLF
jgi:hypothetical protein